MNTVSNNRLPVFFFCSFILVVGVVAFLASIPSPSKYQPELTIDLNRVDKTDKLPENVPTKSAVRIAIAPVISPESVDSLYADFALYIGKKLNRPTVLITKQSYSEINDLVKYQQCDLAFVCGYAYVIGEREAWMQALCVPVVNGENVYYSYIIVPSNSTVSSLLELKGKRFAASDILSNSGWLFPASQLKKQGLDPITFFSERFFAGSHDRSIKAVTNKFVEGAAVDSLVYDSIIMHDPTVASATKIVMKSEPFGMPPLVVPTKIDPIFRKQLWELLTTMHTDPEGIKVLKLLEIDKFVKPQLDLYEPIRQSAKILEE